MLLNLPLEIILHISRQLKIGDKINLKLTCRTLNGYITKAVLQENLNILYLQPRYHPGDYQNNNISESFEELVKDKIDGSLVRVLHLDVNRLLESTRSKLSTVFPNITRLIDTEGRRDRKLPDQFDKSRSDTETGPLLRWRNTIEKIVSRFDWPDLLNDLLFNAYPRLTELDISEFSKVLNFWKTNSLTPFSINAPSITKLTLSNAKMDFEILEAIHQACPLITTLRLLQMDFTESSRHELPQLLVPANSVTYLGLFKAKNICENGVILDYILKKYPSVQQLVYNIDSYGDYTLKTLDQYKYRLDYCKDEEKEKIYEEVKRSEVTYPVYTATEAKFFSNLPSSLKALKLDLNNICNAVAALSESGTNMTTLDLFSSWGYEKRWKYPDMLEYIKRLTSLKTLKIRLPSKVQTFVSDFISLGITRLVVAAGGTVFFFDWILDMFPALEELFIYGNDSMAIDPDLSGPQLGKVYPTLRSLTIKMCPLNPRLFEFVKTSVPNLEELDVEIMVPPSRTIVVHQVDLSGCHLNKCTLSFDSQNYAADTHITIRIEDISKCFVLNNIRNYLFPDSSYSLIPVGRSYKHHKIREFVEIKLGDFRQFKLYDFPIVKIGDTIAVDI